MEPQQQVDLRFVEQFHIVEASAYFQVMVYNDVIDYMGAWGYAPEHVRTHVRKVSQQ